MADGLSVQNSIKFLDYKSPKWRIAFLKIEKKHNISKTVGTSPT